MTIDVELTPPFYADLSGRPLQSGVVYFGVAGSNPVTAPLTVYWDAAATQPAAQPVPVTNGLTLRGGTPARIYIPSAYSRLVLDSQARTVSFDSSLPAPLRSDLALSSGSSLVGTIAAGAGAVARTQEDKNRDQVSVFDFMSNAQKADVRAGTVSIDVSGAMQAAHLASSNVLYPNGAYKQSFAVTALNSSSIEIVGQGAGKAIIVPDAGVQFMTYASAIDELFVHGLKFFGGLGAFSFTATGANVSGIKLIKKCWFKSYTRCAVEENHSDSPYWHIDDCTFDAANSTGTMGIALGGNEDLSVIENCAFLRNRIHIKLRKGGINVKIQHNDFVQFDAGDGTPRAFIWAVPVVGVTNSGNGMRNVGNKFGNENQASTDYRQLYADESAGTLNADQFPNLGADSTGFITAHTIRDLKLTGSFNTPLIYTTTENVHDANIDGIAVDGTQPSYFLQVRTPTTNPDRDGFAIYIGRVTGTFGIDTTTIPISNDTRHKVLLPSNGQFEVDSTNINEYPVLGANRVGYTTLLTTRIGSFTLGGATTKTGDITDATGGAEAAEFSLSTGLAYASLATVTPGQPCWVQIDALQSAASPVTDLRVRLRISGNGAIMWAARINVPAVVAGDITDWRTFLFEVPFRATGSWILEFTSNVGTNVKLGRVRVYQSRAPILTNVVTVEDIKVPNILLATYADDAAAAAGGIQVGQFYRTASAVKIRVA